MFNLILVLILPMRNGNLALNWFLKVILMSSYPTYEEWKLLFSNNCDIVSNMFLSYLWGMETNIYIKTRVGLDIPFLSYLWGMETSINSTYKPLRSISSYPTYEEWKLYQSWLLADNDKSSYPTYEEWKHCENSFRTAWTISSYPTYEEWKLLISFIKPFQNISFLSYLWGMETMVFHIFYHLAISSYPTYEEWKLVSDK